MLREKKVILYIGGFCLPDKNAAAQRVVANAKAFRDLGYEVVFTNFIKNPKSGSYETEYFGFKCYEVEEGTAIEKLAGSKKIIDIANKYQPYAIVAYNYPAISLKKIIRYCKKKGILCWGDVTEWYQPGGNILYKTIKSVDTYLRMKLVHFEMDGLIVISEFLYKYYGKKVPTIKIPPMVDVEDVKWKTDAQKQYTFIYAGSPSDRKERLDIIVRGIEKLSKQYEVSFCIVGITKPQFKDMYGFVPTSQTIIFKGRVSHKEAIDLICSSRWSIIVRNNTLAIRAGFPTKLVESITCGVPVIANEFSNVQDYLNDENSILCKNGEDIFECLERSYENSGICVKKDLFDYRGYLEYIKEWIDKCDVCR